MIDFETRALIDDLNAAYAACIDNDRLEEWPSFFADTCLYQIIPRENRDAKLPQAIVRCDSQGMLKDRIVAHREANIFAPHAYRHIIGRAHIYSKNDGVIETHTNYAVYRTWLDSVDYGKSGLYSVGEYRDRIVILENEVKFAERTVIADTSRIDSLLVTPL